LLPLLLSLPLPQVAESVWTAENLRMILLRQQSIKGFWKGGAVLAPFL
jgi:hypothetical protein